MTGRRLDLDLGRGPITHVPIASDMLTVEYSHKTLGGARDPSPLALSACLRYPWAFLGLVSEDGSIRLYHEPRGQDCAPEAGESDSTGAWELERRLDIAADALRLPRWDADVTRISGACTGRLGGAFLPWVVGQRPHPLAKAKVFPPHGAPPRRVSGCALPDLLPICYHPEPIQADPA